MVSHSEDERVADIADQSLRGNVDHGNNGFDEIPGSRLGKAGFVAVTGSPLISFGEHFGCIFTRQRWVGVSRRLHDTYCR